MEENLYTIFQYRDRNLIAIPTQYKNGAHRFYKGNSTKRRMIKMLMKVLTKLNLEQIISIENNDPIVNFPTFNFNKWLEQVEKQLKTNNLEAIVNFPAQIDRNRFYVDLFVEGKRIGFSKVSLDGENDHQLLNESNKIIDLLSKSYSFKIPQVQAEGIYKNHNYLVYESLPQVKNQTNKSWDSLFKDISNELAQDTVKYKKIIELNWWEKLVEYLTKDEINIFLKNIELNVNDMIEVCLSHGDLHNGNVLLDNDEVWVFDWEASNYEAPIMTDEVGHFLANNQKLYIKDKEELINKLKEYFDDNNMDIRRNILMALAFLTTTGREDSKAILKSLNHYYI